tara:strand:+ start:356 stop:736 length:381 start_codon:yes stop_codon:yes gene_type:complete
MSTYTSSEYRTDCRELAESIFEECIEADLEATPDELREALQESLWESVDSHESVIYTWRAQLVVAHSPNDDYALTEFGPESVLLDDGGVNWSAMAHGAMYADVSEHLWPLYEEWEEAYSSTEEVSA